MNKDIALIGLGKMGDGIARQLVEGGWHVRGFNRSTEVTERLAAETGMQALSSIEEIAQMQSPRLVWIMVSAGKPVDDVLTQLSAILSPGDVVIDGGNSFYEDSISRGKRMTELGIRFIDVGFSGGPGGARNGGCLMVGGDQSAFTELEPLFKDLAKDGKAYAFFPGAGAGHFVKMVHNGIEYGMMQAIAEGVAVLKASPFDIDLIRAMDIYNNGSVIESRLVGWTKSGLEKHGVALEGISGTIGHSGEGEWTIQTADKLGISVPVIEAAFKYRVDSAESPTYTGQVVSVQRNEFGGHDVAQK